MPDLGLGLSLTNPGGVLGFRPNSIAGLQVALIGNDAPSGTIDTWSGSYGTTPSATSAGAARPTKALAAFSTGRAGVRFDGSDDEMSLGDLSALFPSAASLFVVVSLNAEADYCIYETGVADSFWRFSGTGTAYLGAFRTARVDNAGTTPTTGTHLFSVISSASAYVLRLDGVQLYSTTADHAGGAEHRLARSTAGNFLAGDIGAVLIYDSALSAGDISKVETALAADYGVTL